MKCTSCGLPLSPTNTNGTCPRCHAVIGTGTGQTGRTPTASAITPSSPYLYESQRESGIGANTGAGIGAGQPHSQGNIEYMPWPSDTPSPTPMFPQPAQTTPPPGQPWYSAQGSLQTPTPALVQTPIPAQSWISSSPVARNKGGGKLGFTIAGLCVITGALILVFVYIVAMSLPDNGIYNTAATTVTQPTATLRPTPTPSPTLAPSPTSALPGQQYISQGQMASAINQNTAQPTTLATTFKTGKAVYVTFNLNPQGQAGAVCLLWYLNGKFSSHFEFSVGAVKTTAYSFTYYHNPGSASVELYWASSTACTDKQLAQRLTFTVTN